MFARAYASLMVICVPGTMQFELSKERQVRKKKARTWTEAAKLVSSVNEKSHYAAVLSLHVYD